MVPKDSLNGQLSIEKIHLDHLQRIYKSHVFCFSQFIDGGLTTGDLHPDLIRTRPRIKLRDD